MLHGPLDVRSRPPLAHTSLAVAAVAAVAAGAFTQCGMVLGPWLPASWLEAIESP